MFLLGREGGLNCEVAPLPAPSPTQPPTTIAVRTASEYFHLAACVTYFDFKIPRRKILNLVVEFRIREIIKFYSQTMRGVPSGFQNSAEF